MQDNRRCDNWSEKVTWLVALALACAVALAGSALAAKGGEKGPIDMVGKPGSEETAGNNLSSPPLPKKVMTVVLP